MHKASMRLKTTKKKYGAGNIEQKVKLNLKTSGNVKTRNSNFPVIFGYMYNCQFWHSLAAAV